MNRSGDWQIDGWKTLARFSDGRRIVDTNVNAEDRRAAFLRYFRGRVVGFFIGTLLLLLFMKTLGNFHGAFGEATFRWLFGIGAFASFLSPIILAELFLLRDRRLYCPNCGNWLGPQVMPMLKLGKAVTCRGCGTGVPTGEPTRRQRLATSAFIYGGMLALLLIVWLIK
jgi:hypothetical protein